MRILYDVSYVQNRRAGIGRHALLLLRALLQHDTIHHYILHGWSFSIARESLQALVSSRTSLAVARIPGVVKRWYWNRVRHPAIETFVGNVSLVHSTDPFLPPTRARTICTVYDLAYRKFPELLEPRVVAWHSAVERSVRSADALIVPSRQTQLDVLEIFGIEERKIHVVRLPASRDFSAEGIPSDEEVLNRYGLCQPYVLFVGTLEPRKNIPVLVRAFEIARSQTKTDIELVLVGKTGWKVERTRRALAESPARRRIHHLSYVTDADLASLYRRAVCVVYPSLFEGYGFPVLEAMASGAPIITSNNSSMRELAADAGILIDPTNVEQLADAIGALVNDERRRAELRQRGLRVAQRFSDESAARTVLSLYASLSS
ncbi:MAG: hypothetical protein C4326_06400 [Ignavibacteria bacterium]